MSTQTDDTKLISLGVALVIGLGIFIFLDGGVLGLVVYLIVLAMIFGFGG